MEMSREAYGRLVEARMGRSPLGKDCGKAFLTGGLICVLGQLLTTLFRELGMDRTEAGTWTSVTLIGLSALLTGLGVYDRLARHAGAGTLVPITGFANAVAAPAMEFRSEGLITGLAAKMFSVAGPVLTYGISAGVVYGILLWALS